ncbi:MAG: hypothetical protein AAGC67_22240, partial [Myxococcota bacterium]
PAPQELVLDERVPELDLGIEGVVVSRGTPASGEGATASVPPPDVSQETQPLVPETDEVPPQQTLSKFRNADEGAVDENEVTGPGSQLGRIPLVRVRREGAKKPSGLARLLASF